MATILSAQCTDARVNEVTMDLFRKYRSAEDYAAAGAGELEADIRPTGFYNNKARSLRKACAALVQHHGGEVPRTMNEMLQLAGVARKTANVVLGTAFGIATGITVDTHVQRLSRRLGLTRATDPQKIETQLMELVPQDGVDRFRPSPDLARPPRATRASPCAALCAARDLPARGCHGLRADRGRARADHVAVNGERAAHHRVDGELAPQEVAPGGAAAVRERWVAQQAHDRAGKAERIAAAPAGPCARAAPAPGCRRRRSPPPAWRARTHRGSMCTGLPSPTA
ncbi:MAG: hypothetical protein U1E76_13340 [Planctomycetota bacterium]